MSAQRPTEKRVSRKPRTVPYTEYRKVREALWMIYGQLRLVLFENINVENSNLRHYYAQAEKALREARPIRFRKRK